MMNRKSCVTCSRNHVCLTTQRLSPVVVRLRENGSVERKFRFRLSPKMISWTIQACESSPFSIYEISPYKMAPCVFNGITFLLGSSIKPWRSLRAARFTLCIDSDVQKQHRTVPVKQPRASLTPGGKLFSGEGGNVLLLHNDFLKHLTKLHPPAGIISIWSLFTTFGFCSV